MACPGTDWLTDLSQRIPKSTDFGIDWDVEILEDTYRDTSPSACFWWIMVRNVILALFSNLPREGEVGFCYFFILRNLLFYVICYCSSKFFLIFDGNDWNIGDKHQFRADQAEGSVHDFQIYKDCVGSAVAPDIQAKTDSGYQGIAVYHANSEGPYKKSKNQGREGV